jgi:endonuclease/exonuclease/phosphatase family metal-dependent hydrolase
MYNPRYFKVDTSAPLFVQLPDNADGSKHFTRDVLWVKGKLDGETVHVFVNHWPSRLGGEERSAPGRAAAAGVCRRMIDSLQQADPLAKVIVMGDLNDDPINESVTWVMKAKGSTKKLKPGELYNPWMDFYKKGIGTLAYQDAWGLFDQIFISQPFLAREQKGFHYNSAVIFNKDFMVQKTGRYQGYPKRTFDGMVYARGYSDHFPVYLVLLKEVRRGF